MEAEVAIETLKNILISQSVLKIFRREAMTELHTDAFKFGFGAILLQKFDKQRHPVYFYSKNTSDSENKILLLGNKSYIFSCEEVATLPFGITV